MKGYNLFYGGGYMKKENDFWECIFKNSLECAVCGSISHKNNYQKGYIGIPPFKIIICPNCNEALWDGGKIATLIFFLFFVWFWEGEIYINDGDK